jgi:preprotein translocase subunit SecG
MNLEELTIVLAKAFIVILFIMGIISLAIELYDGTLPLPKLLI